MTRNNVFYIFKRIISVILTMSVLLMMTPVWSVTVDSAEVSGDVMPTAEADYTGTGSPTDPYLIYTAEGFAELLGYGGLYPINHLNDCFKLMDNIDLSEYSHWETIGADEAFPFSGTFDGNGHTVTVNVSEGGSYFGLFGVNTGIIKNLGVKGTVAKIAPDGNVGGIAGYNSGGTIYNCYNSANVTGANAGGIVGVNTPNSMIQHCYNTGKVTGSEAGGGIAAQNMGYISCCYNIGEVPSDSFSMMSFYGGIVGFDGSSNYGGGVGNCFFHIEKSYVGIGFPSDTTERRGEEGFNSGEVTWLLQEGQPESIWGQTLSSDEYPLLKVLDNDAERVYKVEFYNGNSKISTKYFNGTLTELPAVTDREGLKAEWRTADDVEYTVGSAITGDIQLYLQWTAKEVHTHNGITFEPWTSTTSLPRDAGNYYLTTDVTINQNWLSRVNINLCLDGHTITRSSSNSDTNAAISVDTNRVLNIYDCQGKGAVKTSDRNCIHIAGFGTANIYGGIFNSNDNTHPAIVVVGTVTIENASVSGPGAVNIQSYGKAIINGGTFETTVSEPTIRAAEYASLKITDGTFIRNNGGNIIQNQGTLEMSGGTVTGRSSSSNGAVGIVNSGTSATATIKDVTITTEGTATDDNTKADKGLRNDNGGTMTVENCNVNSTNRSVWNTGGATIKISGGTFNGRYGMYNNNGTFELSGSPTFTGSTADIYLSSGQKITVTGTLGNAAPYSVLTATDPAVSSPVVITNSSDTYNDASKFTSADGYTVRKNSDGQLELALLATYTITYDKGTPSNVTGSHNADIVAEGESVTLPGAVFTRTGYKQTGWAMSDGGAKVYELNETFSPDDNITLYPFWTVDKYTVTFDYNGATGDNSTEKKEVTYDSTYGTLPTPTKTGYTFDGWFTAASGGSEVTSGTTVTITESQTLYAHWTAKQSTVTFDYQGATSGYETSSITVTYDSTYGDLPTPKKAGYSFGGWFTEESGKGDKIKSDTDVKITAAQTLYASWIDCQHEEMEWTDDQDGEHHSGTCDNCGKHVQNEHNWNDGEITLEPTAETEGEKLFTCTDCKATYTEVIPKHEHDFSGEWEGHDENGHWHICHIDKATDTPVPHEWDDGKVTKPATEIEEGEMTYTCDDCGATKIEKTDKLPPSGDTTEPSTGDSTDPSGGNGAGNITVDSASGENAPNVSISEETSAKLKEEIIAEHLTDEEKAAVANGDSLDVILVVEDAGDTVPAEDKQVTEAVLTKTEYTLGMYLNIDLIKLINGVEVDRITELSTPIRVTIEIPEELRSANRAFAIVRVHNGTAEILEDVDDDPDTITILTDRFSTYSIAYRDTEASNSDNPNTGVTTPIAITGLACAVIVAAVAVKRKKIIE